VNISQPKLRSGKLYNNSIIIIIIIIIIISVQADMDVSSPKAFYKIRPII